LGKWEKRSGAVRLPLSKKLSAPQLGERPKITGKECSPYTFNSKELALVFNGLEPCKRLRGEGSFFVKRFRQANISWGPARKKGDVTWG